MGRNSRQKSILAGPFGVVVVTVLFAAAAVVAAWLEPSEPGLSGGVRVADGDTLQMGPDRIRILGIDAPELAQTCKDGSGKEWACGRQSRAHLSKLIAERTVDCTPDGRDRFDRVLARCKAGGRDLGQEMVAAGMAVSYFDYGAEERAARNAKKGVWQGAFQTPRGWRDGQAGQGSDGNPVDWLFGLFKS